MCNEPDDSIRLYRSYSELPTWLDAAARERVASAFRCIHRIAAALRTLHFNNDSIPLQQFEASVGLSSLYAQGCDLRAECSYVLDSAVHDLPHVLRDLDLWRGERFPEEELPYRTGYASLPDARPIFDEGEVPPEWLRFFRGLVDEFARVDSAIVMSAEKADITPGDMISLCFHSCLLSVSLNSALMICAVARARVLSSGRFEGSRDTLPNSAPN